MKLNFAASVSVALFYSVFAGANAFTSGISIGSYQGAYAWSFQANPDGETSMHGVEPCAVEISQAGLGRITFTAHATDLNEPPPWLAGNFTSLEVEPNQVNQSLLTAGHYQISNGRRGVDLHTLQIDFLKSATQATWLISGSSETTSFGYDVVNAGACQISINTPQIPPRFNMNEPADQTPPLL